MQDKLYSDAERVLSEELKILGLTERIAQLLVNKMDEPEGKVRIDWVKKLVTEYHYPPTQININVPAGVGRDAGKGHSPVYADVVVYRDHNLTMPFVVVETKAPDEKSGIAQAESYARNLGAEYHLWTDGKPPKVWKTSRYPNLSEPIARVPVWISDKPLPEKVPKTEKLRPFKDEAELRSVISYCHDLILEKMGHDPADAFDQITYLLFLKLYDEREVPNYYEFAVLATENEKEVAERIKGLLTKAMKSSKYRDVFASKFANENEKQQVALKLDDFTIFKIVQVLQGYSLVSTTENIQGADIKGTVYESMVGNTFRGELAQFFTPREVVDFVVDVIDPTKDDVVFDPACGSGGFLIMIIRKLREWMARDYPNLSEADRGSAIKYSAEHNLFGTDINDRMVRVSKMNMIMHGDGHAGIFYTNGLLTDSGVPTALTNTIRDNSVDVILSNPPFAGTEKDNGILKQFRLGVNKDKKPIQVSKEVLFVERIIQLLRVGGKAGLVLPSGVFNNPNPVMVGLRAYIKRYTKILALIALPHLAFQITGANNEGNLLFIEKVRHPPPLGKEEDETPLPDYPIYIDWARYVGFNTTGRKIAENELNDILRRMKDPQPENQIMLSEMQDRIDPWYYHPQYDEIAEEMATSPYALTPISKLVSKSDSKFNPKEYPEEIFRYIETNDVDLERNEIISYKEETRTKPPSRAKFILKEGDILIPNARDCIRGVAVVPKEYEGYVGTNRFLVVRPNTDEVLPKYLFYALNQPEVLCLLKQQATGEINPGITYSALDKVEIPHPDKETQEKIVQQIEEYEQRQQILHNEFMRCQKAVTAEVRVGFPPDGIDREKMKKLGYDYVGDCKCAAKRG